MEEQHISDSPTIFCALYVFVVPVVQEDVRDPDQVGWKAQILDTWVGLWVPRQVNICPVLESKKEKILKQTYLEQGHTLQSRIFM